MSIDLELGAEVLARAVDSSQSDEDSDGSTVEVLAVSCCLLVYTVYCVCHRYVHRSETINYFVL